MLGLLWFCWVLGFILIVAFSKGAKWAWQVSAISWLILFLITLL